MSKSYALMRDNVSLSVVKEDEANVLKLKSGDDVVASTELPAGGTNPIPMPSVSGASAAQGDEEATITWSDPENVTIEGVVFVRWAKTTVVRKVGSAPTSKDDGTVVVTETTRNQYSSTGFVDTGLTNGTTYYYGIFAESNTGDVNTEVSVSVIPAPSYPASATGLSITPGDESIKLNFTLPSGIASYKVVYKSGSAPTSASDGTASTTMTSGTTITSGITNGTTYYFKVFTYNAKGRETASSAASGTPTASYPTAATNVAIGATSKSGNTCSIEVTWAKPSDATKAIVYAKADSEPDTSATLKSGDITATSGSYTFTGLSLDTTYYFKVYTYNAKGRSTGSASVNKQVKSLEIVTFADGTDAQIAAMLQAHYDGDIDINDHWSVGDTRTISLTQMTNPNTGESSTTAFPAQNITIVITAIKHHNLATAINGKTKAAITVQCRECLNSTNNYDKNDSMFINGKSDYDTTFTKWSNLLMRTWLNNTFKGALSSTIQGLIKPTVHNRLTTNGSTTQGSTTNGTNADRTTEQVTDSIFLPSYPEVFGNTAYNYYLNKATPASEEGTQWKYFETASNRIKYRNNNGVSTGTACYWWEGSPSSYWNSSGGYYWCYVDSNGSANFYYGSIAYGLAPAFAL